MKATNWRAAERGVVGGNNVFCFIGISVLL